MVFISPFPKVLDCCCWLISFDCCHQVTLFRFQQKTLRICLSLPQSIFISLLACTLKANCKPHARAWIWVEQRIGSPVKERETFRHQLQGINYCVLNQSFLEQVMLPRRKYTATVMEYFQQLELLSFINIAFMLRIVVTECCFSSISPDPFTLFFEGTYF